MRAFCSFSVYSLCAGPHIARVNSLIRRSVATFLQSNMVVVFMPAPPLPRLRPSRQARRVSEKIIANAAAAYRATVTEQCARCTTSVETEPSISRPAPDLPPVPTTM